MAIPEHVKYLQWTLDGRGIISFNENGKISFKPHFSYYVSEWITVDQLRNLASVCASMIAIYDQKPFVPQEVKVENWMFRSKMNAVENGMKNIMSSAQQLSEKLQELVNMLEKQGEII